MMIFSSFMLLSYLKVEVKGVSRITSTVLSVVKLLTFTIPGSPSYPILTD